MNSLFGLKTHGEVAALVQVDVCRLAATEIHSISRLMDVLHSSGEQERRNKQRHKQQNRPFVPSCDVCCLSIECYARSLKTQLVGAMRQVPGCS